MKYLLLLFFHFCFILPIQPQDKFFSNRASYSPFSPIFFQVYLQKDSFIYILNQPSGGTLHLVFPNPDDTENFFTKGEYRIPGKEAHYEIQLEEDLGEEIFYLIISRREIPYLHLRNFRDKESLMSPQWLRKITSDLYPWEWKILETKVLVK
jgi:hypothetical protein